MSLPAELQARVDAVKGRVSLSGTIARSVTLRKAGREWVGLCPFHDERSASFTVNDDKGFYHCFGCGAHGDVLRFVQDSQGLSFVEALRQLEGEASLDPGSGSGAGSARDERVRRSSFKRERPSSRIGSTEAGQAVWAASRPAGPLVFDYLKGRGIDPRDSGVLAVVRFHPRCPIAPWRAWERLDQVSETAPAMLAPICRVLGGPGARQVVQQGLHITFLSDDGGKARFAPRGPEGHRWTPANRQIWGEAGRGALPLPAWPRHAHDGRWRERPEWIDDRGELIVAEGLESTLSLLSSHRRARGAFATLSLGNLQGGHLADGPKLDPGSGSGAGGAGSLRLWQPTPDPERAPFTVVEAGAVTIGIDADMKGLKDRVVQDRPRAAPVRRDLSGRERSELCAALAAAAWRAAGASRVKVVRPPMGRDFNDLAQQQAAEAA